jgi:hypothetical protein
MRIPAITFYLLRELKKLDGLRMSSGRNNAELAERSRKFGEGLPQ